MVASTLVVLFLYGPEPLNDLYRYSTGSPHDRYSVALKWGTGGSPDAARDWLRSARIALETAQPVRLPATQTLTMSRDTSASAMAFSLRRGQRYILENGADSHVGGGPAFIDLFVRTDDGLRGVAHAAERASSLIYEPDEDGVFILRVQQPLDQTAVNVNLFMRTEPTLRLPVNHASRRSIGSFYGDARDGGRRDHHGVDIFATRGAAVVAAASGIVTRVGTNGRGGKVIWISRPFHGESHYYAHLQEQLVTVGTRVEEGDVIGLVGNTGNARSTPPHLHFGIYTPRGAVDPLPYISSLRG